MLIQFSIDGMNEELLSLPLEDLSIKFIESYNRHQRYATRIKSGDTIVVYGSQFITGILSDLVFLVDPVISRIDHNIIIDNFHIADVTVGAKYVDLDFGFDSMKNAIIHKIPYKEYLQSIIIAIERISFGISMIDIYENQNTINKLDFSENSRRYDK